MYEDNDSPTAEPLARTRSSPSQSVSVMSADSPYAQGNGEKGTGLLATQRSASLSLASSNSGGSTPTGAGAAVKRSGWLKKKSPKGVKGVKPWQSRFFVLFESELRYYASEEHFRKSKGDQSKGTIEISKIEALALASDNRIHIGVQRIFRRSDFRTYYLRAEDFAEAQAWVCAIQAQQEVLMSRNVVRLEPRDLSVVLAVALRLPSGNTTTLTLECKGSTTASEVKRRALQLVKDWNLNDAGEEESAAFANGNGSGNGVANGTPNGNGTTQPFGGDEEMRVLLSVEDEDSTFERTWDEDDCLCDLQCWESLRKASAVARVSFIRWDVEINLRRRHALADEIRKEIADILGEKFEFPTQEARDALAYYAEADAVDGEEKEGRRAHGKVHIDADFTEGAWKSLKDVASHDSVPCRCYFPIESMSLTLHCSVDETVSAFKKRVHEAYSAANKDQAGKEGPEMFCLKLVGFAAYLDCREEADRRMGDYSCVSRALESNATLDIRLAKVHATEAEEIEPLNSLTYRKHAAVDTQPSHELAQYLEGLEGAPSDSMHFLDCKAISVWDVHIPIKIRITEVNGLNLGHYPDLGVKTPLSNMRLYCSLGLYIGSESLCMEGDLSTSMVPFTSCAMWNEVLQFSINISDMPRESKICMTLYAVSDAAENAPPEIPSPGGVSSPSKHAIPVGCVSMLVFGHDGVMKTGLLPLQLWPNGPVNPIGAVVDNKTREPFCPGVLFLELEMFDVPIVFPKEDPSGAAYKKAIKLAASQHEDYAGNAGARGPGMDLREIASRKQTVDVAKVVYQSDNDKELIDEIVNADPLTLPNKVHRLLLWSHRDDLVSMPHALPKFLLSVPWNRREAVWEVHRLLSVWAKLTPEAALELLGAKFPDSRVREFAVEHLKGINDNDLKEYVLQLVQVVKHDPYHSSPVGKFLLSKAQENTVIGHYVFWHMKAEMHVPDVRERYAILLHSYLMQCGAFRLTLRDQNAAQESFLSIAESIKKIKGSDEKLKVLRKKLAETRLPPTYCLALNPRLVCGAPKVEKCKYMDSKKLPLWLVLENADPAGKSVYTIVKAGDDLRQDMLTLQMMRIMDKLWKKNKLDLGMNAYDCVATGNETGMLEVVMNAETTSSIAKSAGGTAACFREDPVANWLKENNPSDKEYAHAVDNFTRSCAGYCVATCVLGIGDRHNDNVMIQRDGHLFHIDFGHFLGNFKSKFGFKRERARFVLTPDFAYVMGGENSEGFREFEELCVKAFNILRDHAGLFINLFQLMISSGIPELQTTDDIKYLKESFLLDKDDREAGKIFKSWIRDCLRCKTTQINNAIHTMVH